MSKTILFALLSVAGSSVFTESVFACSQGASCSSHACAAPSCAAPAGGTAPADPHAGMQMSQGNQSPTYQSISHEPGSFEPAVSALAPTYRPMMRQSSPSFYDSVRGDRKVRGQY